MNIARTAAAMVDSMIALVVLFRRRFAAAFAPASGRAWRRSIGNHHARMRGNMQQDASRN
ncbi:MAG: hypothetical protein BWZ10_00192 [candidate division BRC1 bacterium ADurb.BinA364]|nr:MAG: hypothetical protein BWZ10_00192 [candidate division BRC1 bacterium ADurb.BinA364]